MSQMRLSEEYKIINEYCQNAPVDLEAIAHELGIKVHTAYLDDSISGMLEHIREEQFRITLNANHPLTRRRFTLAHELGHYMLHRHLLGEGVDDDIAYRSTEKGKYHNTLIGPKEESEANRFAAIMLMPNALINNAVAEYGKDYEILARQFAVSKASMKIRLDLG